MTDPIFLALYMKGPIFSDIPVYAHLFHSEILRLLVLLVINELTALFVLLPATNGYKKSTGSI